MLPDARHRLETLLDDELGVARELSEVLIAERAALAGDSPAAVHELAGRKVSLLARLEEIEAARQIVCRLAAVELPPRAAANAAPADDVTARWQALLDVIALCRNANEVNGYIINVRRNQVRELIDIVRGGEIPVYGPRGRTSPKAQRALARA